MHSFFCFLYVFYKEYQIAKKIKLQTKKNKPVKNMHPLRELFSFLPIFLSRNSAYVSVSFLPKGINRALNAFPSTKDTPKKAPSSLTNSNPENNMNNAPAVKKASCKTCIFSFASAVKKPFMANTPNTIAEAMPKHTKYRINNAFLSFSTKLTSATAYCSCSLYFFSSSSLQYTKCPGLTSRMEGGFVE